MNRNGPKTFDLFKAFFYNTIFDERFSKEYVPLQYFEDLERRKATLRQLIERGSEGEVTVLIPVRSAELALPLVSIFVYSKLAQLAREVGGEMEISTVVSVGGTSQESAGVSRVVRGFRKLFEKVERTARVIEIQHLLSSVESVDDELSQAAGHLFENLTEGQVKAEDEAQLGEIFDIIVRAAFLLTDRRAVVLCGQDQARAYSYLMSKLAHSAGRQTLSLAPGIFIPRVEFFGNHVFLDDSMSTVRKKVCLVLENLRGKGHQLRWAEDLMRLSSWTYCVEGRKGGLESVNSIDELSSLVSDQLFEWMTSTRREWSTDD